MIQIIKNDYLGMALHAALYHRLVTFAEKYTPEYPANIASQAWLNRVYGGDDSIILLVELNDSHQITAHALVSIQEAFGYKVIICHQVLDDKKGNQFIGELLQFLDKLRVSEQATCIRFEVVKNAKYYRERHGYNEMRTVLIKTPQEVEENG